MFKKVVCVLAGMLNSVSGKNHKYAKHQMLLKSYYTVVIDFTVFNRNAIPQTQTRSIFFV
jgi:hypothetical protein